MVLVLCYDITSDSRRTRLHNRLKAWLTPVQKSVFEGVVPASLLSDLLDAVEAGIDHTTDSVRIYQLCRGCAPLVRLIGVSPAVEPPSTTIIH